MEAMDKSLKVGEDEWREEHEILCLKRSLNFEV